MPPKFLPGPHDLLWAIKTEILIYHEELDKLYKKIDEILSQITPQKYGAKDARDLSVTYAAIAAYTEALDSRKKELKDFKLKKKEVQTT